MTCCSLVFEAHILKTNNGQPKKLSKTQHPLKKIVFLIFF